MWEWGDDHALVMDGFTIDDEQRHAIGILLHHRRAGGSGQKNIKSNAHAGNPHLLDVDDVAAPPSDAVVFQLGGVRCRP